MELYHPSFFAYFAITGSGPGILADMLSSALNINGMLKEGDKHGQKIIDVGAGDQELPMLKIVRNSGWRGPIGILNHRPETDSEEILRKNLAGLAKLEKELID